MMRFLICILYAGLAVGCRTEPLPSSGDAGLTCASLPAMVQSWLVSHQQCSVDSDCKWIGSGCGLPYQCGSAFNVSAQGAYLDELVASWNRQDCVTQCPQCPVGV